MPRTNIYYRDWEQCGIHYRLELTPSDDWGHGLNPLPSTTIPEWGEAPDEGSIYIDMGERVIVDLDMSGEEGFDHIPLGAQDLGLLDMGFDLAALHVAEDTRLHDLPDYLLNPRTIGGGTLVMAESYPFRTFDTYNAITLLSDLAGAGDAPAVAAVVTHDYSALGGVPSGTPISSLTDGVSVGGGDRVLVVSETDQTLNGIYLVDSGDWTRTGDVITPGLRVPVTSGTLYGGTAFVCTNAAIPTPDVDPITFALTESGAAGIAAFRVLFQGVQTLHEPASLKVRRDDPVAELKVTAIHIAQACLEAVSPAAVSEHFLRVYNTSDWWGPSNSDNSSGVNYDYVYRDDGVNFARTHQKKDIQYDKARYFKLQSLFSCIADLAEDAYRSFYRIDPVDHALTYAIKSTATGEAGTPYDNLAMHRQTYTKANTRGALLDLDERYFLGIVWPKGISGNSMTPEHYDDTVVPQLLGGFLAPQSGDEGLFKFKTVWDFVRQCTEGPHCKITFVLDRYGCTMWFSRIGETVGGRVLQLTYRDFETDGGGLDAEIAIRREYVTGAAVTANLQGGDANPVYFRVGQNAQMDSFGMTLVFHNEPRLEDAANRYRLQASIGNRDDYNPDIAEPFIGGASSGFDVRQLFYFDQPAGISSNVIPIRVHDQVGIDTGYGDGVIYDGAAAELPVTTLSALSGPVSRFDAGWWQPLQQTMFGVQQVSCMAYSYARRLTELCSAVSQFTLETTLDAALAPMPGDRVQLCDADGSPGDLSAIFPDAPYLGGRGGIGIITAITPKYSTGLVDVSIFFVS